MIDPARSRICKNFEGGTPGNGVDARFKIVNDSARYIKVVEWSDEDQCFVGQCPGVVGPCCHGDNEAQIYAELCEIVGECLAILKTDGKPLPPATAGQGIAERIACA